MQEQQIKFYFGKSSNKSILHHCLKPGSYFADFYTYAADKEDVLEVLKEILASNYIESPKKEELEEYFKVVENYNVKKEIEKLTKMIKNEYDPIEQAKIAEKIKELRMGEN